jgi:hypothetical protein
MTHVPDGGGRYERTDVRASPVLRFALALAVLIGAALAVCAWVARALARAVPGQERARPLSALHEPHLEPELEARSGAALAGVRAREDERLTSYGWVDAQNGIVRIPIDHAIELLAERGLPAREPPERKEQR